MEETNNNPAGENAQPAQQQQPAISMEDRMAKMMELITESLISMRNMQHENQQMNRQIMELTKDKLNMSAIDEGDQKQRLKKSNRMKPTRPKIETDMEEVSWKIFIDDWDRYKRRAELDDEDEICLELRDACSSDVNKLLYQFNGADELNSKSMTEIKLLELIRNAAVKIIHPEVHRLNFNAIKQSEGETAARFVGRLKVKASLCDFTVKCACGCDHDVSYAEEMVSQRLIGGLSNQEHQSKILGDATKLDTLNKKIERILSLETTDEAADKIRQPSAIAAMRASQYKKERRVGFVKPDEGRKQVRHFKDRSSFKRRTPRCRGCGKSSHGEGKKMFRTDCPAYNKKCNNCGKEDHFAEVCEQRKRHRANFVRNDDDTSPGETSGEDEEYEYDCDHSDTGNTEPESESHHLSTSLQDFRYATSPRHPR